MTRSRRSQRVRLDAEEKAWRRHSLERGATTCGALREVIFMNTQTHVLLGLAAFARRSPARDRRGGVPLSDVLGAEGASGSSSRSVEIAPLLVVPWRRYRSWWARSPLAIVALSCAGAALHWHLQLGSGVAGDGG